jgi:hypothetical protein
MNATMSRTGKVTIEFDAGNGQEILLAPNGQQYLPCANNCGMLLNENLNVITSWCPDCWAAIQAGRVPPEGSGPPYDAATATGMYDP